MSHLWLSLWETKPNLDQHRQAISITDTNKHMQDKTFNPGGSTHSVTNSIPATCLELKCLFWWFNIYITHSLVIFNMCFILFIHNHDGCIVTVASHAPQNKQINKINEDWKKINSQIYCKSMWNVSFLRHYCQPKLLQNTITVFKSFLNTPPVSRTNIHVYSTVISGSWIWLAERSTIFQW